MKILQVTQAYYPFLDRGGPAVKVRSIAQELVKQGHQAAILTADLGFRPGEIAAASAVRNGQGWRSNLDGVEAIYLAAQGHYRNLTVNVGVIGFCRRRLREFDIVHTYGLYDALGPVVARYCRQFGIPYFVEPLGMTRPIDRGFLLKRVWSKLTSGYLSQASRIIATSELERGELIANGFPPDRVLLRYNGVDLEDFRQLPQPGAFRRKAGICDTDRLVVFLGRLIPRKGADLLIEALPQLECDSTRLVIAGPEGESGYLDFLRAKARALGVEHRVLFTGALYGEEKKAVLADASVFALPSRYENFGNSAAEAIACGTPAIVSDRCGIAPLIDLRAGLVTSYSPGEVARTLRGFFENRSLSQRLKAGCAGVAEEITWGRLVKELQSAYDVVVDESQAKSQNFYDDHPFDWTEGYTRQELDATLAPPLKSFIQDMPSDCVVLDIGCGAGRVTSCLAARGLRCVGIDLSRTSVRLMMQRTGNPGVVADGLRLPFADGTADRVIADGVIHHTSDPFAAFAEGCRVLKSGGLLYVAVYKPGGRYQKMYGFPGAIIRSLLRRRAGKALVHATVLPLYYLAHVVKSRGKRSWQGARNLFYDYFVTPRVQFLSSDELRQWSETCGVDVVCYKPNPGLNVHSFLIRKRSGSSRAESLVVAEASG